MYLVDDIPTSNIGAYASPDANDCKEVVHSEMTIFFLMRLRS
jgi:hypothetical protein